MLKTVFDKEDRAEIGRLAIKAMPLLIAIPAISYWMTFEHRVHGSQQVILYYLIVSTLSLLASVMLGFLLLYQSIGGKKPHPLVVQYKFWITLCCLLCAANFLTIYRERSSLYLWSVAKLREHKMMGPEADYERISQSVVSRRWAVVFLAIDPQTGASKGKLSSEVRIRAYEINADGLQFFAADEVGADPDGKTHFTYKNGVGGTWYDDLISNQRGGKLTITPRPSAFDPQWFEGQFNDENRGHDPSDYLMRNYKIAPLGSN